MLIVDREASKQLMGCADAVCFSSLVSRLDHEWAVSLLSFCLSPSRRHYILPLPPISLRLCTNLVILIGLYSF